MFEKSLQDLVKGIRNSKNDSTAYIAKAIQEIKEELKNRDVTIKAQALQKLTYVRDVTALADGEGGRQQRRPAL
jgi:AP-3 complex subunit delta-1